MWKTVEVREGEEADSRPNCLKYTRHLLLHTGWCVVQLVVGIGNISLSEVKYIRVVSLLTVALAGRYFWARSGGAVVIVSNTGHRAKAFGGGEVSDILEVTRAATFFSLKQFQRCLLQLSFVVVYC